MGPMRILAAFLALTVGFSAQDDKPWKLLTSRKVEQRIAAVRALASGEEPDAEKHLLSALGDADWEVAELAAQALIERAGKDSIVALVRAAVDGETRRLRLFAAQALGRLDRETAAKALIDKAKGALVLRAVEALGRVGGPTALAALEKAAKSAEPAVRAVALSGIANAAAPEIRDRLDKMTKAGTVTERVAGMEGLSRLHDAAALDSLLQLLATSTTRSDVEVRRIQFAIRDLCHALERKGEGAAAIERVRTKLRSPGDSLVADRMVRLVVELARGSDPVGDAEEWRREIQAFGIDSPTLPANVRRACLGAVRTLRAVDAAPGVAKLHAAADDASVRFHALRTLCDLGAKEATDAAIRAIRTDADVANREDAAALAGLHGLVSAGPALAEVLDDGNWTVAVAAAISLGKIRHKDSAAKLVDMLGHSDWRRRGAAALAIAWFRDHDLTDRLIDQLQDDDPCVKATVHRSLEAITGRRDSDNRGRWQTWWKKNRNGFKFVDLPAEEREARDSGYARGYGMYKNMDIVVLDTREGGDNIEELLERLKIEHRITVVGQVENAKLHPFALFVANCPGEINDADAKRLEWFVRTGGYLFSSCWSLTHTIGRIAPGVVRQHPTSEQVMDTVLAEPLPRSPRFLSGVFRDGTQTRYVLEGSHLITVSDPDRFEVLIDSVPCAERWGEGNLCGWFTVGHGLILDSANHFDLQGMQRDAADKAEGRKAQAIDILGYSHEEVRELDKKGVFKSATRSTKELEDLSMFRLITNFVRQKRLAEL